MRNNMNPYPMITMQEAIDQGSTPSQLRATANSLERIAREGYLYEFETTHAYINEFGNMIDIKLVADLSRSVYDARKAFSSARHLRTIAKQIERSARETERNSRWY